MALNARSVAPNAGSASRDGCGTICNMRAAFETISPSPGREKVIAAIGDLLKILIVLTQVFCFSALWAQRVSEPPFGVAWRVAGVWRLKGSEAPILTGDAVPPGSLLQPDDRGSIHSMIVLLPDGQRIFDECFNRQECERGFRVPMLYHIPASFDADMMARIHAALVRAPDYATAASSQPPDLPQDEVVAVLGQGNTVRVGGLVSALPNGHYTYSLRRLQSGHADQLDRTLEKNAESVTFELPSAGLYSLTIVDSLHRPRIDLLIAALKPGQQTSSLIKSFDRAHRLLGDWNIDYQGWPIHEFQRAYLESYLLNIRPPSKRPQPGTAKVTLDPGATAEPVFSPKPGVFHGDTAVTLHCATPGAVIRFTIDNSQPHNSSEIFRAPIMVKGTELTIKAFASATNKKDSPVVVGIFRIGED